MTAGPTVSVVVPTIGRASLTRAVASALGQSSAPHEVIVVLDKDCEVGLPASDAVVVVKTEGGVGPARARQRGIEVATGELIALLDDDDQWMPDKLRTQLASAPSGDRWIVSSRVVAGEGAAAAVFPRRLIGPAQSVAEYLFSFRSLRFGGASLQTSTLLFPRTVATQVPLSVSAGSVHDDPTWLMAVRDALPDLPILHCPEVLVNYGLTAGSLSRTTDDRSREYLQWGLEHLRGETPRTRGDYLLTSPVAAAVAAATPLGALRAIVAGVRHGRPGPGAYIYALAGVLRIVVRRLGAAVPRVRGGTTTR